MRRVFLSSLLILICSAVLFNLSAQTKPLTNNDDVVQLTKGATLTGFSSYTYTAKYQGAAAAIQISSARPVFCLVWPDKLVQEFHIIQFEKKRNRREVQFISANTGGTKGMKDKYVRKLVVRRVANDVFTLTPSSDQEGGVLLLTTDCLVGWVRLRHHRDRPILGSEDR